MMVASAKSPEILTSEDPYLQTSPSFAINSWCDFSPEIFGDLHGCPTICLPKPSLRIGLLESGIGTLEAPELKGTKLRSFESTENGDPRVTKQYNRITFTYLHNSAPLKVV